MPDPKPDLPEGTDKIINGAMDTTDTAKFPPDELSGTGAVSATPIESDDIDSESIDTGPRSSVGQRSGGSSGTGALMDRVRSGGEKLSVQAADKARGLLGQGLERSAEALANVGKLVGETADGLDERLGEEYGDYARRAAGAIENAANNLAAKDPDELVDETREFIRKSPGVALAGAAIAGFAIARLIKSGLSRDDDDDSDDSDDSGKSGDGKRRKRS